MPFALAAACESVLAQKNVVSYRVCTYQQQPATDTPLALGAPRQSVLAKKNMFVSYCVCA